MRDVMKHLGSVHDGDSLEGEHAFRNPGKRQMTERQAEELVWKLHN